MKVIGFKKRGFTLLESVITMGCISIILLLAHAIFEFSSKMFSVSDSKSTLQMQANDIHESISKVIMGGKNIEYIEYYDDNYKNMKKIKIECIKEDSEDYCSCNIEFDKENNSLIMGHTILSEELDSDKNSDYKDLYRIYKSNLVGINVTDLNGDLIKAGETSAVKIKIILKEKDFVQYTCEFIVSLRNK